MVQEYQIKKIEKDKLDKEQQNEDVIAIVYGNALIKGRIIYALTIESIQLSSKKTIFCVCQAPISSINKIFIYTPEMNGIPITIVNPRKNLPSSLYQEFLPNKNQVYECSSEYITQFESIAHVQMDVQNVIKHVTFSKNKKPCEWNPDEGEIYFDVSNNLDDQDSKKEGTADLINNITVMLDLSNIDSARLDESSRTIDYERSRMSDDEESRLIDDEDDGSIMRSGESEIINQSNIDIDKLNELIQSNIDALESTFNNLTALTLMFPVYQNSTSQETQKNNEVYTYLKQYVASLSEKYHIYLYPVLTNSLDNFADEYVNNKFAEQIADQISRGQVIEIEGLLFEYETSIYKYVEFAKAKENVKGFIVGPNIDTLLNLQLNGNYPFISALVNFIQQIKDQFTSSSRYDVQISYVLDLLEINIERALPLLKCVDFIGIKVNYMVCESNKLACYSSVAGYLDKSNNIQANANDKIKYYYNIQDVIDRIRKLKNITNTIKDKSVKIIEFNLFSFDSESINQSIMSLNPVTYDYFVRCVNDFFSKEENKQLVDLLFLSYWSSFTKFKSELMFNLVSNPECDDELNPYYINGKLSNIAIAKIIRSVYKSYGFNTEQIYIDNSINEVERGIIINTSTNFSGLITFIQDMYNITSRCTCYDSNEEFSVPYLARYFLNEADHKKSDNFTQDHQLEYGLATIKQGDVLSYSLVHKDYSVQAYEKYSVDLKFQIIHNY